MFYFHPYLGKIPILTNIFQRGWNHQLVDVEWIFMGHVKCPIDIREYWLHFSLPCNYPWICHFRHEGCRSFEVTLGLLGFFFRPFISIIWFQDMSEFLGQQPRFSKVSFLSFLLKFTWNMFFVFNMDQLWCLSPRPLATIPQNGSG